jgi:hypothetical protein
MIPAAMRIRFCREEEWGGTGEGGVGGCIRIRRLNDTMVYGAKQVPGLQAFYDYQEALWTARLAVWPVWCILQGDQWIFRSVENRITAGRQDARRRG